jgi:hypothetical protein
MPPLSHRDIKIADPIDDLHGTFPAAQTVPVIYIRRAAPPRNRRSASTPGRLPLIADRPAAAERSADEKMRVVTVLRSPGAPRQLTVWRERFCFTELV